MIEKIRHWSLQRQCLGKQASGLEEALKAVIAVYSAHPSGPLSLYARVKSFSEEDFYALDTERRVLRMPVMRQSVHILPRETARRVRAATLPPPNDPEWEKRYSQRGRSIPKELYAAWQSEILALVKSPLTVSELKPKCGIPEEMLKMVLNRMTFEESVLRTGARSLSSNIIGYVSSREWIGENPQPEKEEDALEWLAGEYLRAFGPARITDFKWWAGLTMTKARAAVSKLKTVDLGGGYLLPAADLPAFESLSVSKKDQIDLLPQWDCYTMGYAPDGRERFVNPGVQGQLYGNLGATGGNALGAILLDGWTIGSWTSRFKGPKMELSLNMFEKPGESVSEKIENGFAEIAALLGAKGLVWG